MKIGRNIAILGATSHIAQGLIWNFSQNPDYQLHLFGRKPDVISKFIQANSISAKTISVSNYDNFPSSGNDCVINCVGLGDPAKVRNAGADIFTITETFDNMVLNELSKNPETLYVNFSSGAVYGKSFGNPAEESTVFQLDINHISAKDYYALAKIGSEAKHRAHPEWNIIDLRVFSYYSRFIDPNAGFLLSEILRCLNDNKEFVTGPNNIVRDYIAPADLFQLVLKCIQHQKLNNVFDIYSRKAVTKFEILDFFKNGYGLQVKMNDEIAGLNATGAKDVYYSNNKRAEKIGFDPKFSSLEAIEIETKAVYSR